MKEIEANKNAWSRLSKDHYENFKKALLEGRHRFNPYIERELGDLAGKRIIHLQCNTGADTLLLAKKAAFVTGVDLVPDNIHYARKLAGDLSAENVSFIESNILELSDVHDEKYDMVFVSEGAIGWLPDLKKWGETIAHLLKEGGVFYCFDSHPFFLSFDESKIGDGIYEIKYPYFDKTPDEDDSIGGYASEPKGGVKAYFWMYTVSELINSLIGAGLQIEYFNEFKENFYNSGGLQALGNGLYNSPFNSRGLFPMSFSLRARLAPLLICK